MILKQELALLFAYLNMDMAWCCRLATALEKVQLLKSSTAKIEKENPYGSLALTSVESCLFNPTFSLILQFWDYLDYNFGFWDSKMMY